MNTQHGPKGAAAGNGGPPRAPSPLVRHADIAALSAVAGTGFAMLRPDLAPESAALRGRYQMLKMRSGLSLHASDTLDMHDLTTRIVHTEGLTVSLFLQGLADVTLGGRAFLLGPAARGGELEGVVIARAEMDLFERRGRCGSHVRKVNVTIPAQWLEQEGLADLADHRAVLAFSRDHLASARWKLSSRLKALAEQILDPPPYNGLLQGLYLESRAIEIAAEALGVMGRLAAPSGPLRGAEQRRMWAVHDFIAARLADDLTLDLIAREAGMSVNTLQRLFRAAFGVTVFEHVRQRRLDLARAALEEGDLTVTQAAYVAGYTAPANFATAFKRAFGVSPKSVRRPGAPGTADICGGGAGRSGEG